MNSLVSSRYPLQMKRKMISPAGQPRPAKRRRLRASKRSQKTNSALYRAPAAMNLSARSSRERRVITHRECERIGTVTGSDAFASSGNFAINPGLASSFPWLSGVAQHYERYRMDSFLVRFKNLKGTTYNGNVIMSFDYDTLDDGPTTAVVQTQSTVYADGAPYRVFEMLVPTDGTIKYVRTGTIAGADLKTYDFGRVWISAEGCDDTSSLGYIEFEYVVSLFEKQTASASSPNNLTYSQWNLAANAAMTSAGTLDCSEEVVTASSDAPTNASGVLTLPSGLWLITGEGSNTGGTDTASTMEILLNGASITPPVTISCAGAANALRSWSLSTVVSSTGSDTAEIYFNRTVDQTFKGDMCRISARAI